jgi:hypothetical protein
MGLRGGFPWCADFARWLCLRTGFDLDGLTPITPEELAQAFDDAALARQFVQGMTVVSLAEGPPTEAQGQLMTRFANALDVDEPTVKVLRELAEHHMVLFRLDFMRRSHLADAARMSIHEKGLIDVSAAPHHKQSLERLVTAHTVLRGCDFWRLQPGGGRIGVLKSVSVVS